MKDYTVIYKEAFEKANSLYNVTQLEWQEIMQAYIAKREADPKLPEGYELVKNHPELAINKNAIIIDAITLVPVPMHKHPEHVMKHVLVGDVYIAVNKLMAIQYLDYVDGLIIHLDGDIYNNSLSNLKIGKDINESYPTARGKSQCLQLLLRGVDNAFEKGDVTYITFEYINISDIKSGQLIASFSDGNIIGSPVISSMNVIVNPDEQIEYTTKCGTVTTSKRHPVAVVKSKVTPIDTLTDEHISWIEAQHLTVGDVTLNLLNHELTYVEVDSITQGSKDKHFRDLTVLGSANYFVRGNGSNSLLVHNTRKGAVAVYIEPWHQDIFSFLDMKKTGTEERLAARDLFPAIWANDLFFDRVREDGKWTLFDPFQVRELHSLHGEEFNKAYTSYEEDENIRKVVIRARDLMEEMMLLYYTTGSPFLLRKDEINKRHQCDNIGVIRSSNLCTEIMNATSPGVSVTDVYFKDQTSITLASSEMIKTDSGIEKKPSRLNTTDSFGGKQVAYITNRNVDKKIAVCNLASINLSKIDEVDDLRDLVFTAIRALDNVIDINFYPVKAAMDTNLESRSIGLGVMGEHHYLAINNIMYGSQEHLEKIDEIYERITYYAIEASIELAEEKGAYPAFEGSNWSKGILPIDTASQGAIDLTTREHTMDWDSLRERAKKGIRNGYIMAIAPTSTISIYTSTTSSIEPIFKKAYMENNAAGSYKIIAPDLSADTWQYYESAYDIDQIKVINAAAIRQKWLDQAQPLTLCIKSGEITGDELVNLYLYGQTVGIKSFYYLRSLSPAELKTDDSETEGVVCDACQ